MGPMRKKIVFILLALIMLGAIAYFYVNRFLLPKVHTLIESRIAEQIGRPVSIGRIRLEPAEGFRLQNVIIREPGSQQTFVQIDEIDCALLLAPFLKNRTVVIPSITIRKPITRIVQHTDGSFNFSDMLKRKKKPPSDHGTQVFITQIKVVQAAVDFVKNTADGDFSENFRDIGIDLSLSMDRQIDFRLTTVMPFDSTSIEASGRYTLGSKDFYVEIKASQWNVMKYQRQFYPLKNFAIESGELATCDLRVDYFDSKLKISGDAYFAGTAFSAGEHGFRGDLRLLASTLLFDHGSLTAKGELRLPAMELTMRPGEKYEGDLQLFVESLTRKDDGLFVSGNIKARNVNLTFPGEQSVQTHLTARDSNLTYRDGKLTIFGDFDFEDAHYSFGKDRAFNGQLFAKNLSLSRDHGTWKLKSTLRSENTRLTFGPAELVNSTVNSDQFLFESTPEAITLDGSLAFSEAVFAFGDTVKFQGNPDLKIQYHRPRADPESSTVTGLLALQNGLIFGLPRVESLSNLQGALRLTKDGAETEQISFTVENTHIDVTGKLNNWSELALEASAYTPSIELSRVTALMPEIFEKYEITLDGRSALRVDFTGSARQWKGGNIQLAAELMDSTLSCPKLPGDITQIGGQIGYSSDRVTWSELKAVFKNFPFQLSGQLENFSRPVINTTMTADDLKARARISLLNKTIRVPSVTAQYHQSDFDGSADIYFITGQPPEIQINGRGTVYASDLAAFAPSFRDKIEPLALEGIFDTKLFFKGKPGEHLDWSIDVDAKSDRAVIKNHPLTDVKITYLQRDKNISKLNMNADVYGGKLKFDSSANLENTNFPFVMALGIYDTDLAKFIVNQTPDKENKLAGTFSLNLGLEGELTDQQSWTGQGDYKIENGYIWDFKIIKVLNKLLIREFVRTVYTDSSANFRIANRKIGTENLTLKSDTISLLAKGYVDFDQKLSFDVYPALSEIARIQSDDEILKKFTTVLLSKTLNIIKLGGTIQEPKHSIVATQIPTNILKGTLDTIRGVGESLFETIINP